MNKLSRLLGPALAMTLALSAAASALEFTVVGIDCAACAAPIRKALNAIPGVSNAAVDWKAGTARVDVAEGFDKSRIRKALDAIGYEAVFSGEESSGLSPLPPDVAKTLDRISFDGSRPWTSRRASLPGRSRSSTTGRSGAARATFSMPACSTSSRRVPTSRFAA